METVALEAEVVAGKSWVCSPPRGDSLGSQVEDRGMECQRLPAGLNWMLGKAKIWLGILWEWSGEFCRARNLGFHCEWMGGHQCSEVRSD